MGEPEWMPPPGTVWAVEAGTHWDAVRVDRGLGLQALSVLGDSAGPVIQDPWGKILYFLVPAGSTRDWNVAHTVPCGAGHYVGVPALEAAERTLHWMIRPTGQKPLGGDPDTLRAALGSAMRAAFVHHQTAGR
ncbi:hypothetical protein ACXZ65_05940 [Streptomyces aculeolatus]